MRKRKNKGIKIDGWLNLNKPAGITSTQALNKVRAALNAQKAGHGGTLDPLASGVLPIALGGATKTVQYAQDSLKTYRFTVSWGERRTTDDAEGEIIAASPERPSRGDIEAILPRFTGDIQQVPPQFSAVKIGGERAYDLARDGETVEIQPRPAYIQSINIVEYQSDTTSFECTCGKGTYVRALARDMGEMLGCHGYISALERTAVGSLRLENAIPLDFFADMADKTPQEREALMEDRLLPLWTVLDDIPALALRDTEAVRLKQGQPLSFVAKPDLDRLKQAGIEAAGITALATLDGQALALVAVDGPSIKPLRILNA